MQRPADRHSQTGDDPKAVRRAHTDREIFDPSADLLCDGFNRPSVFEPVNEYDELIATEATNDIEPARFLTKNARNHLNDTIPRQVTELVIDRFEVVDINYQ